MSELIIMKQNLFYITVITVILSVLSFSPACRGEDSDNVSKNDSIKISNTDKTFKFGNKLFSIPSPFVASDLVKKISEDFNSDFLNPAENKINYTTTYAKALNLGVYTADLAYSNIYEQLSVTTKYIKVVRSLSSDLQILNSYTDKVIENFENNLNDKDSLNKIFTDAYRETDLYLSKNNREDVADLVITGAWVEGLYLMTKLAEENKNKELINRIGEQKYSLNNLLNLLKNHNLNTGKTKLLYEKLFDLNNEFRKIDIQYNYVNKIVAPAEKKTVIISETTITVSPEILKNIKNKTAETRKLIVK